MAIEVRLDHELARAAHDLAELADQSGITPLLPNLSILKAEKAKAVGCPRWTPWLNCQPGDLFVRVPD